MTLQHHSAEQALAQYIDSIIEDVDVDINALETILLNGGGMLQFAEGSDSALLVWPRDEEYPYLRVFLVELIIESSIVIGEMGDEEDAELGSYDATPDGRHRFNRVDEEIAMYLRPKRAADRSQSDECEMIILRVKLEMAGGFHAGFMACRRLTTSY